MRLHEIYFGNLTKKRTKLEKTAGFGVQLARDFERSAHATVRA
jgi:hypothetical protein